jgi:two-component system response regulator FixJ
VEGDRTIYVVDDDAGVRRSLQQLLIAEGFAVMSFASAAAFLDVAPRLFPGCVLLDILMPEMDGLELQVRLRDLGVALPVVIMTGHGDVPMAVKAMKAGAVDFLKKPYSDTDLLGAVETALRRGGSAKGDRDVIVAARLIASLSPREREVLDALASGRPNKLIAFDLGISVRTVEVHRSRMMRRLGVRQFAEAVRIAVLATRLTPGGRPDSAADS